MRKRTRVILWSVGGLGVIAAVATAVILLTFRPGRGADRLVGSWEGQGDERTRMEGVIGKEKFDLPLALQTAAKATFHKDGRLEWSFRAEAPDFHFSFEVPDPKKPEEFGRWEVVRSDTDDLVVRLTYFPPTGHEYRVSFRNPDEFAMTPVDFATGTGTIVFRRVGPGK